MKIHDVQQGEEAWLKLRAEKITASEAKALLTPLFKVKDGKAVETLLARKLSERWLGTPLPDEDFSSLPMEWGKILEIEAKPMFRLLTDLEIHNVGFMSDDDGICGCSPDAVGDNFGVEIKSPGMPQHVKSLLAGKVLDEYLVQCHFSMFVSGFPCWYFMSYRRLMPSLIIKIERDDKIQSSIADAVSLFAAKMQAGWATLIEWRQRTQAHQDC
jgi:hypothetical protein